MECLGNEDVLVCATITGHPSLGCLCRLERDFLKALENEKSKTKVLASGYFISWSKAPHRVRRGEKG